MDSVECEGHIQVHKVYQDRRRELVYDQKNQLTNGFLVAVTQMLCRRPLDRPEPGNASSWAQWGIYSAWIEASSSDLSAPEKSDTEPEGSVVDYVEFNRNDDITIDNKFNQPSNKQGVITISFEVGENSPANNVNDPIRAFGIYTKGDNPTDPTQGYTVDNDADTPTLLARQLAGPFEKNDTFSLEYTWKLQFSIKSD